MAQEIFSTRQNRFSEPQIVAILNEHDAGGPIMLVDQARNMKVAMGLGSIRRSKATRTISVHLTRRSKCAAQSSEYL